MKLKIREKLQRLSGDMFYTDYAGDIVNLLVNKPKEYRFLYDAQADLYMICDAWEHIHMDMMNQAFRSGLYEDQKDFLNDTIGFYNRGMYQDYFSFGTETIELEEDEEDRWVSPEQFSDNVAKDENFIYPWIYCFGFLPNGNEEDEKDLINDGYDHTYKFSFGKVYTRDFDLSDCEDLQRALNRADN